MTLFDYLQHCSKDEFVEWMYEFAVATEDSLAERLDEKLGEHGLTVDKVSLSPDLRKTIILQGLESELHAT